MQAALTVWAPFFSGACLLVCIAVGLNAVLFPALPLQRPGWDFPAVCETLRGSLPAFPAAVVDMDAFEANVAAYADIARKAGKRIRIATKSIRVPHLISSVLTGPHADVYKGVMAFSVAEASFLWREVGVRDILLAYPVVHGPALAVGMEAIQSGADITFMADCPAHLHALQAAAIEARLQQPVRVCLDVDMSWRPLDLLHVGVQRSGLRTAPDVRRVLAEAAACPAVAVVGVMGYEAQVAGLPDATTLGWLPNWLVHGIKAVSVPHAARQRAMAVRACLAAGCGPPLLVNGGGTGSVASTVQDALVTEVTVGSGLLHSTLFDRYTGRVSRPALALALQVTRLPQLGVATAHGGGFIASGAVGRDKQPSVVHPHGARPLQDEGFGEVQTPLQWPRGAPAPRLGDVVLARPAKAGEVAEHFNTYALCRGMHSSACAVQEQVLTYRGHGMELH